MKYGVRSALFLYGEFEWSISTASGAAAGRDHLADWAGIHNISVASWFCGEPWMTMSIVSEFSFVTQRPRASSPSCCIKSFNSETGILPSSRSCHLTTCQCGLV